MLKVILFCSFVFVVTIVSIFVLRQIMKEIEKVAKDAKLNLDYISKTIESNEKVNKIDNCFGRE